MFSIDDKVKISSNNKMDCGKTLSCGIKDVRTITFAVCFDNEAMEDIG
jgi:hypothetical protein